jgi:hypothetical protein
LFITIAYSQSASSLRISEINRKNRISLHFTSLHFTSQPTKPTNQHPSNMQNTLHTLTHTLTLAAASGTKTTPGPLFGNQWLALAAILAGVLVFTLLVGFIGRLLAATHPDSTAVFRLNLAPAKKTAVPPDTSGEAISPQIAVVIAAAVHTEFGNRARPSDVHLANSRTAGASRDAEQPALQWALEGRRKIFASHKPAHHGWRSGLTTKN